MHKQETGSLVLQIPGRIVACYMTHPIMCKVAKIFVLLLGVFSSLSSGKDLVSTVAKIKVQTRTDVPKFPYFSYKLSQIFSRWIQLTCMNFM
jgi:hypothetical protein